MANTDKAIGRRAAAEIRVRAYERRTTYTVQRELLGLEQSVFHRWENGLGAPGAKFLQAMALDGYDVHYILTGERRSPCP